MNIKDIVIDFDNIVSKKGYKLYFGTKNSYNAKKNISKKEIIIEPFDMKAVRKEKCNFKTTIKMWLGNTRQLDTNSIDYKPDVLAEYIDNLIIEYTNLLYDINDNDYFLIPKKLEDIILKYYEANSTVTLNNQSFIMAEFPIIIYDKIN